MSPTVPKRLPPPFAGPREKHQDQSGSRETKGRARVFIVLFMGRSGQGAVHRVKVGDLEFQGAQGCLYVTHTWSWSDGGRGMSALVHKSFMRA